MTDKDLRDRVLAELEWIPSIDEAHLRVTATDGIISLSGYVKSYLEKYEAEQAARRIVGVKAISDEIEVRLPAEHKASDEDIARFALDMLAYDAQVPHDAIRLRVAHGHVTLMGMVPWHYQRAAAEWNVRKLAGVTGVSNQIRLMPQAPSANVRMQIESALRRDAAVMAAGIDVQVDGRKVILGGKVHSYAERVAAERAAWAAPGVTQVVDHINLATRLRPVS